MNGNDQFDDRLSRLTELGDDELDSLEQEMVAAFDTADSGGDIDQMQALADALDELRAEKATREGGATPAAEEETASVAASGEEDGETDQPPAEDETTGEGTEETPESEDAADGAAATDEPASPDTPAVEGEGEQPDVTVNGADGAVIVTAPHDNKEETVKVTSADVPEGNQPVTASSAPNYAITAGGDIPGLTAGSTLDDMDGVIDAMTRKINGMRGVTGDGEHVVVASLRRDLEAEFGDDRILRRGDPEGNSAKIRKFLKENDSIEALTAAGWCAPKTPLYDIPGIGSTDTPVADSLASFGVDRGGIVWTEPPTLGGLTALMNPAFGVWKNTATSGAPTWQFVPNPTGTGTASATKPCIEIPCGTERSTEIGAIPLCLCFDNLTARANPELVRASTDLVMVGQAKFKEQWLMAQMFGAAGVVNTPATIGTPDTPLGVARDFLVTVRLVAAQFRWRNRLAANQQVRIYAPAWLRDAIASDLLIQIPGDDSMDVGYSEIDGYLSSVNVSPVWYIDDVPTGVGTAPTAAASSFDSYLGYGQTAEWLVTLPGVFTRLDGGSLDLGVVRTKEDVQANKYCEFAETFEGVAYMGPTTAANAWAVRGTTPVSIRGGFAPAVATIPAGGVIIE